MAGLLEDPLTTPAFQFYPDEWLASTAITLMCAAQEGAYIRLLCHCWNDPSCSIPDDDESLAILSRLGSAWAELGDRVRRCFVASSTPGRLVNVRLLKEREKQEAWRKKSAKGAASTNNRRRVSSVQTAKASPTSEPCRPNGDRQTPALQSAVCTLQTVVIETPKAPKGAGESKSTKGKRPAVGSTYPPAFEAFWKAFPRKQAKPEAWMRWVSNKIPEQPELLPKILAAIEQQSKSPQWTKDGGQFIPRASTWLNRHQWDDVALVAKAPAESMADGSSGWEKL